MLGSHGGDATAATSGGAAQTVHFSLSRSPYSADPGLIVVTVDKHNHPCRSRVPHTQHAEEYAHDLGMDGIIRLSARGGRGGNGGNGGNGEGGGHGRDGMNATKSRNGTDGENGCDGGNAGRGTSGGNGGKGGDVTIFLKEEDKDLLIAMSTPIVTGGKAGLAGKNGIPGRGGRGGVGGQSYSWSHPSSTN